MENFNKIVEVLNEVQSDVQKFMNGNGSAGTRVRKAMQEVKKLAQEVRLEVQQIKNNK